MGRYRKYAEYKDTGVAWLGLVPTHWHIHKTKHLFVRMQRAVTPEDEIVTAFRDGQVTLRSNRRTDGFTQSIKEIGYQGVKSGDLVVHAMDGFAGAIGVSDSDGKCSPVYSVCVANRGRQLEMRYYGYLVRQLAVTEYITALARGIRERSTEFRYNEFASLDLACPPHPEQTQIAAFLDYETAKIDALIAKQQELIALLKEKRQATISHAVTKGLNPDAPMRDSGVEWLGKIPAHWMILPLRAVADIVDPNPSHRNPVYVESGFPFISTVEFVGTDEIELDTPRRVDLKTVEEQEMRCSFGNGSLAFSRKGTIGSVRVLPSGVRFALLDSVCVINSGVNLDYRYLYRQLTSSLIESQLGSMTRGAALKQISVGRVRNLKVVLPPIGEQKEIIKRTKTILARIDSSISLSEEQISLLEERRTALISAAVTGKIDVRDWRPPASPTQPREEAHV